MKNFNGGLSLEIEMLPQVNFGVTPPTQQAREAVIAQLLSNMINDQGLSPTAFSLAHVQE
jgi:hypothetical protein